MFRCGAGLVDLGQAQRAVNKSGQQQERGRSLTVFGVRLSAVGQETRQYGED